MAASIPTTVGRNNSTSSTRFVEAPRPGEGRSTSYGATSSSRAIGKRPETSEDGGGSAITPRGYDPEAIYSDDEESEEGTEDALEPLYPYTWRFKSRLYLIVPVATIIFAAALMLLVTFAWPPNEKERKHGQTYPHAILWEPFVIGVFASCTIQTARVPVWVVVSWFGVNRYTAFLSTILHSILHELTRLITLPLVRPSPTSGFHSSYYLGLGWGVAETIWGIFQGYEQLALYEDVMQPEESDTEDKAGKGDSEFTTGLSEVTDLTETENLRYRREREDEAELERRVELLERMRERRDLEEVLGVPLPDIPLPLFVLWRLDTLLLNLGLTLILSAFYYDPVPIYRHQVPKHGSPAKSPSREPSPYLFTVFVLVALLHVVVSLVWKVVGRVGVGAVTWGALIVALGTVFAGLGAWGGLV